MKMNTVRKRYTCAQEVIVGIYLRAKFWFCLYLCVSIPHGVLASRVNDPLEFFIVTSMRVDVRVWDEYLEGGVYLCVYVRIIIIVMYVMIGNVLLSYEDG